MGGIKLYDLCSKDLIDIIHHLERVRDELKQENEKLKDLDESNMEKIDIQEGNNIRLQNENFNLKQKLDSIKEIICEMKHFYVSEEFLENFEDILNKIEEE